MESCSRDYGTRHSILVLIEEGDVLQAYQPEEVDILLNVGQCVSVNMIQVACLRVLA